MKKNKVISAQEAIALIRENDVVTTTGFVQSCIPEALHAALEKRFVDTGSPRGLTLIMTAGAGDSKGLGTGRLHHDGLLTRVIAANFGRMPKVAQAAADNRIRGFNLPQGVISQLYRACAAGQPLADRRIPPDTPRSRCGRSARKRLRPGMHCPHAGHFTRYGAHASQARLSQDQHPQPVRCRAADARVIGASLGADQAVAVLGGATAGVPS